MHNISMSSLCSALATGIAEVISKIFILAASVRSFANRYFENNNRVIAVAAPRPLSITNRNVVSQEPLGGNVERDPVILSMPGNLVQNQVLKLSFHGQLLTVPPDVSQNPALQSLYLDNNQLGEAPDVSQNPALLRLYLDNNQLRKAPDVRQNPALQILYLWGNQLEEAPDVSQNPALQTLMLNHNRLTKLHDSILSLPNTCVVYAQRNKFSAEYIADFRARLAKHRALHPDQGPTVYMSVNDAPL